MALPVKRIKEIGRDIVLQNPGGIRYAEIVRKILEQDPSANPRTVEAQVANELVQTYPTELVKPSRGLYMPRTGQDQASTGHDGSVRAESEFYEPFARFLEQDLDEATTAIEIGGSSLRTKWGTPDVVGVYRPVTSDLVKFTPEIVAAEIKTDPSQPVVAFGQAVAYRLFSTRAYAVMPQSMTPEDQARLEALCMLFGVGFVLFDPAAPTAPRWQIRVRAQSHTPDIFYVNEFARRLHDAHPDKFNRLFN